MKSLKYLEKYYTSLYEKDAGVTYLGKCIT